MRWSALVCLLWMPVVGSMPLGSAERGSDRYALILTDPPLAERFSPLRAKGARNAAAEDYSRQIRASQATLHRELKSRNVPVTGSVQSLMNSVFVRAQRNQVEELRGLPGVKDIVPLPRLHLKLDKAVPLVGGPTAWAALGGAGNAGTQVKIAIIDTGIDQNHPAFLDDSLAVPEGFPKCDAQDCAFTNQKVIVARSYIRQLGEGTLPNPAADSRPDDTSPRDRVGHGTALAMVAAGLTNSGPAATITGLAPKAYLGNYKVFGSPGVNDGTSGDVVISALEDALNDGMDVAVLSLGGPAFSGPLDQGQVCGLRPGSPCDPLATAVENAVRAGLIVVVAAGNEGDTGSQLPTPGTISSPATAPSAISVGATTNSHTFASSLRVLGADVPDNLRTIPGLFGGGLVPSVPLTAPLRDVTQLGNDGLACSSLSATSLAGAVALIQRGTCLFLTKVVNAQNAGAVGVVFYQVDGDDSIFHPGGLSGTGIPAMLVGNTNGHSLKSFVASHTNAFVSLDPALTQVETSSFNAMASFSSRGPSTGDSSIKPEIVAVGTNMYMATQRFDANGDMYDASGYTVASGTSFSTPMVAGAVSLVKQKNPGFSPGQLKSAIVNTSTQDITENGEPASVTAQGAGKLDVGAALQTTVTVEPATLSFGVLQSLPVHQELLIRNIGTTSLNLALAVAPRTFDSRARLSVDKSSLSLDPGQSVAVTLTLSGSLPLPGSYEGALVILGGGATLKVPYLYLVGDGIPSNMVPLVGSYFEGPVNEAPPAGGIAFRVTDRYGVPVQGASVQFRVSRGGGSVRNADSRTDVYGIAGADVILGPALGLQEFAAQVGSLTLRFYGFARQRPAIKANGVVNAASFEVGPGVAPGSYIAIFGTSLSDVTQVASTIPLPLSLGGVSVSFDVPSAGLSLPGTVYFVSPGQVNVQVPWELRGQSSALVKVSIGGVSGNVYTVPLADYAPAVFEYTEPSTSMRLAAALDENSRLIDSRSPARRGRAVQLFMNGLGPVDNQPLTGEPTPLEPLSRTLTFPTVTIGGRTASVQFSGLAPLFSGLYQVNVEVPWDTPSGIQPLTVTINGVTAKTVNLPVE